MSSLKHDALQHWLDEWKFRANPFEKRRAEDEPELGRYFVSTPAYHDAHRGKSSLIFAQSGCGKTAHRCMLVKDASSDVLTVEYVEFSALIPEQPNTPIEVSARQHINEILCLATQTLLDTLLDQAYLLEDLPGEWIAQLAWFWQNHAPSLARPSASLSWLRKHRNVQLDWEQFRSAVEAHQTRRYLEEHAVDIPEAKFLAALFDLEPEAPIRPDLLALIQHFVSLLPQVGMTRLHVLLDCLGDHSRLRTNLVDLFRLVYPLFSDLRLMTLPELTLTYFLPDAIYGYLSHHKDATLLDRLGYHRLVWNETTMSKVIEERLAIYRQRPNDDTVMIESGKEIGLAGLCETGMQQSIERDIFELAKGSLREALRLCDLLLDAHCNQAGESAQFNYKDWKLMVSNYNLSESLMFDHPPLRIQIETASVTLGDKQITLPNALFDFLLQFYQKPNEWLNYDAVGVGNNTFRKYISRLRQEIEPDHKIPIYLLTKRNKGAMLQNVWIEQI